MNLPNQSQSISSAANFQVSGSAATLIYDGKDFAGFSATKIATEDVDRLQSIVGTAVYIDRFPELADNPECLLVNRGNGIELKKYLASNLSRLGINRMLDTLKNILLDLGKAIVYSCEKGITLDLSLTNIMVLEGGQYPKLKVIAKSNEVGVNVGVGLKILHAYEQIWQECNMANNLEISYLKSMLRKDNGNGSMNQVFKSFVFWDKEYRIYQVSMLGDLIEQSVTVFGRGLEDSGQNCLLKWRSILERDSVVGAYVKSANPNKYNPRSTYLYQMVEIDLLILVLRATLAHFELLKSKGLIVSCADKYELLERYEGQYPEIMFNVYIGSERLTIKQIECLRRLRRS